MSEADKIIESLKKSGRKVEEFYTGNKTSDKNVANVTKNDIDILNALIYVYEARLPNYNELMDSEVKSLKNILADYTRQKQLNEEHQKINGELREKVTKLEETIKDYQRMYCRAVNDSIPKQKIKDKIEELIIQGNYKTFYNPNGRTHFLKEESDYKIEVLQELLQEEDK